MVIRQGKKAVLSIKIRLLCHVYIYIQTLRLWIWGRRSLHPLRPLTGRIYLFVLPRAAEFTPRDPPCTK